jgi:hypothetical protein
MSIQDLKSVRAAQEADRRSRLLELYQWLTRDKLSDLESSMLSAAIRDLRLYDEDIRGIVGSIAKMRRLKADDDGMGGADSATKSAAAERKKAEAAVQKAKHDLANATAALALADDKAKRAESVRTSIAAFKARYPGLWEIATGGKAGLARAS